MIAGQLGPVLGWRGCFLVMGAIGIFATIAVSRIKDVAPARDALPPIGQQFGEFWALFRRNARLRWASLAIIVLHAHVATSPFVQLWLHEDKGLETAAANSLYGLMFIPFGLIGSIGAGVLADWAHRRFQIDRASSAFGMLILLVPLILAYRMMPASSAFFIAGMAASILFMTMIYGPLFSVIEEQLPSHLKATATGLNMLTLNILMIGGLALAIGVVSQNLAESGSTQSWTLPLLMADLIAFCGVPMVWLAARAATRRPSALSVQGEDA
jgi:predicted MFS family arabinose efflux permease